MRLKMTVEGRSGDFASAMAGVLDEKIVAAKARMARIHRDAMKTVGDRAKAKMRQDWVSAGFHKAAATAKTWQGKVYPNRPVTLEPAYQLKTKAGVIIDAFTYGATIKAGGGKYLAIPLPPAKAILRRENRGAQRDDGGRFVKRGGSVQRVAAAIGQALVPIIDPRTGKGVLVAMGRTAFTPSGRESKRQTGRGTPMFVLVKQATLRPRMQGRKLLDQMAQNAHGEIVAEIARLSAGSED